MLLRRPDRPPFDRIIAGILALLCLVSAVRAQGPLGTLQNMYPGVRTYAMEGRPTYIYGREMTGGETTEAAAAAFLSEHGAVFGVGALEVRALWRSPTADGRFEVFAYKQQIRGKDVDGSIMRVKTRRGPFPRVDYAAARLAAEPTIGLEEPGITAEHALMVVQLQVGYGVLAPVGEPTLVALRGDGTRPDAWCWRIQVRNVASPRQERHTFYVDTAAAQIIHVRAQFSHADSTTGVVQGEGSALTGLLPYGATGHQLEWQAIPGIRVTGTTASGSAHTFTGDDGNFDLELGTTGQSIAVESSFSQAAQWYRVMQESGLLSASTTTQVGAQVTLQLTSSDSEEYRVAQVNAVRNVHRSREFTKTYISQNLTGFNWPAYIHTNSGMSLSCNGSAGPSGLFGPEAWDIYLAPSRDDSGYHCRNAASHTFVPHEYGHLILFMLEEGGASAFAIYFHEGYADSFQHMLNDEPVMGKLHWLNDTNVRDDPTSSGINCQYPVANDPNPNCVCPSGNTPSGHSAGQLLAGVWTRIRNEFKVEWDDEGLEMSRDLFGAWTLITVGGEAQCNSAHPGTAVEVLEVAPESVPAIDIICDAFSEHNISCP